MLEHKNDYVQGCWLILFHHFPRFLLRILNLWLKTYLLQEYWHAQNNLYISKRYMKCGTSFKIQIFGVEIQIWPRDLGERFEKIKSLQGFEIGMRIHMMIHIKVHSLAPYCILLVDLENLPWNYVYLT
jgi:hypothetical protein